MGMYKRIVTNVAEDKKFITEYKMDIVDVILTILCVVFALFSVYLFNENEKLLKQVDYAMGKYNEACYQLDQVNNAYESLKEEYDYAIEIIRTSDKYDLPEEMEE